MLLPLLLWFQTIFQVLKFSCRDLLSISHKTTISSSSEHRQDGFTSLSTPIPSIIYHGVTDQQVVIITPSSSQAKTDLTEETPTMVLHVSKPSTSKTIIFMENADDEDKLFSAVTDRRFFDQTVWGTIWEELSTSGLNTFKGSLAPPIGTPNISYWNWLAVGILMSHLRNLQHNCARTTNEG